MDGGISGVDMSIKGIYAGSDCHFYACHVLSGGSSVGPVLHPAANSNHPTHSGKRGVGEDRHLLITNNARRNVGVVSLYFAS